MGRVVEDGEPTWLPEDRDILAVWSHFQRSRYECGHWPWQAEGVEGLHIDYEVCSICRDMNKAREKLRETRKDMYGVSFAYYRTSRREAPNGN